MESLPQLLARQSGVVTRAQARERGLADHDIRRRLRRREWSPVHDGVYVDHTGPLTWRQRSWAAVLAMAPAALCHQSALRAEELTGADELADDGRAIHVVIDRGRSVVAPGVVRHRLADFEAKVRPHTSPPRQRFDEAVVDVAAGARDDLAAVAVLAAAVGSRRTTAPRVAAALAGRSRIARRDFLAGVLADVAAGSCSVLEHGYLDRVERPHGLPLAGRQVRASARGTIYRDVDYAPLPLIVELDGRLVHGTFSQVDADLERDLLAAIDARDTVRLGWGQVFGRPCLTARAVAVLLTHRGWAGRPRRCPACPDSGGTTSPGDVVPPLSP